MNRAPAPAKLNLALVVGELRADGKHDVVTVLQRIDVCDRLRVERAPRLRVHGFPHDTLVTQALTELARAAGVAPRFEAWIEKKIPVAAGLGGGSSDAATSLRLGNRLLDEGLDDAALADVAGRLGADVPFFLHQGPQLARGDGSVLEPLDLPQDYYVVLVLPHDVRKESTASVYAAFDGRGGAARFDERAAALERALSGIRRARDLAALPPNDLAASPVADELRVHGAFRADVSGAGPVVYGLFVHERAARDAARALRGRGRTWVTIPAWYG